MNKYQLYDAIIKQWYREYPDEAVDFLQGLKEARETRLNEFAASKSKSLRWGLSIPVSLYKRLSKLDPEFLSTKVRFRNFMRVFPQFMVAEKI